MDDYLETLLIHLIRGGGYQALNSLPIYREGIFRPLLIFKEKEIKTILELQNWKVFEDESNASESFLRNRIRKNILPLLKREGLQLDKLHENFHNSEIFLPEENADLQKTKIPSFIRIDKNALVQISLGNLKILLDSYARILKIHPINKNILTSIKRELDKQSSFLIENKEIQFWKSVQSDLYLLPTSSILFQKAKCVAGNTHQIITWNSRTNIIPLGFAVDSWQKGLKIQKNGIHKEVSELLREKQIPIPIRNFIPILFKQDQACAILFSLWDDKYKDFIGDFFHEIR